MKCRSKKIVEYVVWPGYLSSEMEEFAGKWLKPTEPREGIGVVGYYLVTFRGDMWLHKGDYIIKNGDICAYRDPIAFEKEYEIILGN